MWVVRIRTFFLVFGFVSGVSRADVWAQDREYLAVPAEVIDSRESQAWVYQEYRNKPASSRGIQEPKTLSITPGSPFFDDFSKANSFPDTNLWYISAKGKSPLPTQYMAMGSPTWGAMTFDGADITGIPYNTRTLSNGVADELRSHYLDLSPYGPSDGLTLSFFLQPQGRGNAPESTDQFRVLCTRADAPADSLEEVWAISGAPNQAFKQYVISFEDPAYFHEKFQLIFQSVGSLNGNLDHWHLDYVNLGLGRTSRDTVYQDQGIQDLSLNIMMPFTAYPALLFPPPNPDNATLSLRVNNLDDTDKTIGTRLRMLEPEGNVVQFSRDFELFPQQANAFEVVLRDALLPFGAKSGLLQVEAELSNAGIQQGNDYLQRAFRVDSLMAYDDGEADGSYGLNRPKAFGVRFRVPTGGGYALSALWINFVPRIDVDPTTGQGQYLDGKGFRLVIWDETHPDSILYSQGNVSVQYGDSANQFVRFPLSETVVLPDTFWVGLQQLDAVPLGVGLDRNAQTQELYWDSLGVWTASRILGLPMIRPEIRLASDSLPTSSQSKLAPLPVLLRNDGTQANSFWVAVDVPDFRGEIQVLDLSGKRLVNQAIQSKSTQLDLSTLSSGIYILYLHGRSGPRYQGNFVQKILIGSSSY